MLHTHDDTDVCGLYISATNVHLMHLWLDKSLEGVMQHAAPAALNLAACILGHHVRRRLHEAQKQTVEDTHHGTYTYGLKWNDSVVAIPQAWGCGRGLRREAAVNALPPLSTPTVLPPHHLM